MLQEAHKQIVECLLKRDVVNEQSIDEPFRYD